VPDRPLSRWEPPLGQAPLSRQPSASTHASPAAPGGPTSGSPAVSFSEQPQRRSRSPGQTPRSRRPPRVARRAAVVSPRFSSFCWRWSLLPSGGHGRPLGAGRNVPQFDDPHSHSANARIVMDELTASPSPNRWLSGPLEEASDRATEAARRSSRGLRFCSEPAGRPRNGGRASCSHVLSTSRRSNASCAPPRPAPGWRKRRVATKGLVRGVGRRSPSCRP
jgi:hypothetical protein